MKITVHSSKVVKPVYRGGGAPPAAMDVVPLSVFDKVAIDTYVSSLYFFHPPAPSTAVLQTGLAVALAAYREWAGRLVGADAATGSHRAILLNDLGARFVEATADVELGGVAALEPTPELRSLCPSGDNGDGGELMMVQVTRFACGSFAVGTATHHFVADGHGRSSFMTAWGEATRGGAAVNLTVRHRLVHDRASLFAPRNPPRVEFEHRGVEFVKAGRNNDDENKVVGGINNVAVEDKVVVRRVHFTRAMVAALKSRASSSAAGACCSRPYSSLQCVAAHLWRCVTTARGLAGGTVTTLKLAVNGSPRMRGIPDGYVGNVVLWARPAATAGELLREPLRRTADRISRALAQMDESYFQSFVDFAAGSGAVEDEGLVPAEMPPGSADIFVSNLKGIPVYDVEFAGAGRPFLFTRCNPPVDGYVFVVPPSCSDGSVDVQVGLSGRAMDVFKDCCYSQLTAEDDA